MTTDPLSLNYARAPQNFEEWRTRHGHRYDEAEIELVRMAWAVASQENRAFVEALCEALRKGDALADAIYMRETPEFIKDRLTEYRSASFRAARLSLPPELRAP